MVIRVSDKKKNYSKVTKLLVKPLKYPFPSKKSLRKLEKYKIVDLVKRMRTLHNHSK